MTPNPEIIAAVARTWLGTPYRHQAATLGAGCDCLGLLRGVWRALYGSEPISLPPYRADWRDPAHAETLLAGARQLLVPAAAPLATGQIVLFAMRRAHAPKHCAILIAPDRFVHAQERLGVCEAGLSESWRRRIAAVFTFPEFEAD